MNRCREIPASRIKGDTGGETPFSVFFEEFKRTALVVFSNLFNEMEQGGSYSYITKILMVNPLTPKKYFEKQSAWKLAYLYVIHYEVSSLNVSGLRYWRSRICFWTHLVHLCWNAHVTFPSFIFLPFGFIYDWISSRCHHRVFLTHFFIIFLC